MKRPRPDSNEKSADGVVRRTGSVLLSGRVLSLAALLWCSTAGAAAGAWSPPAPIGSLSANAAEYMRASIDPNGKAHVVWGARDAGGVCQIWYSTNAGGSFSTPAQVTNGSTTSDWPHVASDGTDVHVTWSGITDGLLQVWYRKKSGGTWGSATQVSFSSDTSMASSIALKGNGAPVLVWCTAQSGGSAYDIFFSEWNGSSFTSPINLSANPPGDGYGSVWPNVAVSPNGDITVIWPDSVHVKSRLNARRRVAGVWQATTEVASPLAYGHLPGIAAAPDNTVHVAFGSPESSIVYQKWTGTSWTAPVTLPTGVGGFMRPSITVDGADAAHVTAESSGSGNYEVYYSTNASASWSSWTNLSNNPMRSAFSSIGWGSGVLTVVYQDNNDGAGGEGGYHPWHTRSDYLPPGELRGTVRGRADSPLAGVTITTTPGNYGSTTNSNGVYIIPSISPGTYAITAAAPGYWPQTKTGIVVHEGQSTTCDFTLAVAIPGDFDGDDDVDMEDFGHFQSCLTGAGYTQDDRACQDARLDGDVDVDEDDFVIFQKCLSGAGVPASPDCAN